ncbi:54S ribosomal protein L20, mitochondrial [Smittium culicis]|uniref:54S ribosomal protein L20, mitochondrial n=1 Tax=Smittium culicis TaxID=133412 RepID=A0A1R1YU08_9FUNG|nr:54S ribosomal protein L20, mitochondrial [Smittium culicis]
MNTKLNTRFLASIPLLSKQVLKPKNICINNYTTAQSNNLSRCRNPANIPHVTSFLGNSKFIINKYSTSSRNYSSGFVTDEQQIDINQLPSKKNFFKTKIYSKYVMEDNSIFESRVEIAVPNSKAIKESTLSQAELPPLINKHDIDSINGTSNYVKLSDEQVTELVKLRNEDPVHWTRTRLAKKFGCSEVFVGMVAKCPKWRITQIQAENEAKWSKMGYKKRLIKINRIRRRLAW